MAELPGEGASQEEVNNAYNMGAPKDVQPNTPDEWASIIKRGDEQTEAELTRVRVPGFKDAEPAGPAELPEDAGLVQSANPTQFTGPTHAIPGAGDNTAPVRGLGIVPSPPGEQPPVQPPQ